jgi:protein-L-isoaspartate(D-aspartate) O-methyltransferase
MKYQNIAIILIIMFSFCDMQSQDYAAKRKKMVERQISSRGVTDQKVLDAMLKIERHLFVPVEFISSAYEDSPLPIGEGQTISQPYIVAYMTELLKLDKEKKVLEIGTGSGYQTAILAELAGEVYSIELIRSLGKNAAEILDKLKYQNIHLKIGDGYQGWTENAPFDAIIVTCSPTKIPEPLQQQLAENGIMVIPVGQHYVQELVIVTKKNGKLKHRNVTGVRFVPMKDNEGNKY